MLATQSPLLAIITVFQICFVSLQAIGQTDANQERVVIVRQPLLRHPNRVELSFAVAGRVRELMFEEGDVVAAGDILATLENDRELAEYTLKKARAEADELLASAEARLKAAQYGLSQALRGNELQKGAIPAHELRRLELELEVASAELIEKNAEKRLLVLETAVAKANYESTILRAPFDGTITRRLLSKGASIDGLKSIGQLVDQSKIRVEGYVTLQDSLRISPGHKMVIMRMTDEKAVIDLQFVDIGAQQVQKLVRVWGQMEADGLFIEGEEISAVIRLDIAIENE